MNALITTKNACALLVFLFVCCARAQEGGCDGPVFHPGSNNDCSDCVGGGCSGSGTTLYSYYSCGGNTAETCNFSEKTIGYTGNCSFNFDDAWAQLNYQADLQDCAFHLRWHVQNNSSCDCEVTTMPDKCDYGYCAVSSGTAIKGYEYIGSSGVCTLAMALMLKTFGMPVGI